MSRTHLLELYKIIVRCEQRDGPHQPSAHHVTGSSKNIVAKSLFLSFALNFSNKMFVR